MKPLPAMCARGESGFAARWVCLLLLVGWMLQVSVPGIARAQVSVSVSIPPLAMIVEAVGGDMVSVDTLLPPGASPHGFEPTPRTVRRLADARLVVTIGSGLDPWTERLIRAVGPDTRQLVVSDHVPLAHADGADAAGRHDDEHADEHGAGHDHGGRDPHFWLDPVLVAEHVVPAVAAALGAVAPEHGALFQERARDARAWLMALNEEIAQTLAPVAGRPFVAFHGTWNYLARRYGLTPVAAISPAPGREPSARWMGHVIETARETGARVILVEPQFNDRLARTISGQFGGHVVTADPLGGVGTPGGPTYDGLMRFNAGVLREALAP